MSRRPETQCLRLRVLLPHGELAQWIGDLLLALDQASGVALQLRRVDAAPKRPSLSWASALLRTRIAGLAHWSPNPLASQRLAHWAQAATGACDITLVLAAGLRPSTADTGGAALQWALVDAAGQPLCPQFPLLSSICSGQGIQLALNQLDALTGLWRPCRRLHLGATPRYGRAMHALSPAVARLVLQGVIDCKTGVDATHPPENRGVKAASIDVNDTPDVRLQFWTIYLYGLARALVARFKALVLSEYWRIGVIDAPIHTLLDDAQQPKVRWLTAATSAGYWADPFGMPGDPHRLACEYFDEQAGVGHLEVLMFGAHAQVVERTRLVVSAGQHSSFPNIFEFDGRRLGVAETIATRECVLYEVDASGQWRRLFSLLQDVAAADPALFAWEGRFWLAYTDADMGSLDNLCLQYADTLEGPWRAHANNPVKVDIAGARMAGGLFRHQGALYRPAQNCLRTYGGAMVVHQITALTPRHFSEVVLRVLTPDAQGACPHGLHTLNAWGERTLVDGKRHGVNPVALWRQLRLRLGRERARISTSSVPPRPDGNDTLRHVLVYVPHLRTGGGEISMLRLAAGLAAVGLKVDLVVHSEATRELDVPSGVTLINLNCGGTAAAVWRLSQLLRGRRPDWLLSAFPHTNIAAVVAMALAGLDSRCILSEHAPLSLQIENQGSWRYRLLPPLVRWAYRRAHAVVAVSGGVRDDLQRLLGPGVAPHVISNPVLAPDFEAEMAQVPDDPWFLDSTLQVVLSVCRLSVEKDLVTLVRAFAEVHCARPATRLVLAGEGPDRPRLMALVADLGLDGVVRLPGRTAMPLALMRHASVFVLASQYEGFGNVLVEAMACGTPVVSTDCPVGPREVLDGGRLGALVPVGDAPAMAQAITAALVRPAPPPGARKAALGYTQTNASAAYLALFNSLYAVGSK